MRRINCHCSCGEFIEIGLIANVGKGMLETKKSMVMLDLPRMKALRAELNAMIAELQASEPGIADFYHEPPT